jgi:hypothetical protein
MTRNNSQNNNRNAVATIQPARMQMPAHLAEEYDLNQDSWRALVEAVFPSAETVGAVAMALAYCKKNHLDIFQRPVHIVPMWTGGRKIETVWPGIAQLRIIAQRQPDFGGYDECEFGPDVTETFQGKAKGSGGSTYDVQAEVTYPEWARFTVYKIINGARIPMPGPKVWWRETFSNKATAAGECPNEMWHRRPRGQLEKCFSPDTEILTEQGFQRFDSVSAPVLQVSERGLESTAAEPFCRAWSGEMIVSDGQSLNFAVTPNHDMVTTDGKVEAGVMLDQSSTIAKYRIPLTLSATKAERSDIPDTSLQLVAAFLCDGSGRAERKQFVISVSRPRKVATLDAMEAHDNRSVRVCAGSKAIAKSGRTIETKRDKVQFAYSRDLLCGLVNHKKEPNWSALLELSQRQARVIVDSMVVFDGATGETYRRFYTSNPTIAGVFELLAVAAGYSVSPRRARTSDISSRPNFCISLSTKRAAPVLAKSDKAEVVRREAVNPSGAVWCVTVPSGVIVVRRNGLSMLCGNCAEAASLRRAFPDVLGNEYAMEEMENRDPSKMGIEVEGEYTEVDQGDGKAITSKPRRSDYQARERGSAAAKQVSGREVRKEQAKEQGQPDPQPEEVHPLDTDEIPNKEQWPFHMRLLRERLATFVHTAQVDELQRDEQFRTDCAPPAIQAEILEIFANRAAHLDAGASQAADGKDDQPEQDNGGSDSEESSD